MISSWGIKPAFNMPTANLAAWYDANLGITIATGVSQWNDQSGNARHLLQATGGNQPSYTTDAKGRNTLLFNGTTHYMKATAFTLNQPETVYLVGTQVTVTANDTVFDGNALNTMRLYETGAAAQVQMYAGTGGPASTAWTAATPKVVACVFNGASSSIRVNTGAAGSGNAGASNAGGFTLGAAGNLGTQSNIQIYEVAIYSVAHDAATQQRIIAGLAAKWGIVLP